MTRSSLLFRSIRYHWRTNLAVMLGVVAATAVIGGAFVVGDSVRESLKQMTLDRLGRVDYALSSPRFFREEIASDLAGKLSPPLETVAPALVMQGSLEVSMSNSRLRRAGEIQLYGLDERLWNMLEHGEVAAPAEDRVILSARVASQLGAKAGDSVSMFVKLPSAIPRDSLLGNRDEFSREVTVTVQTVLDEDSNVGRFSLNPNQQLPLNAFVSLSTLQDALDLSEVSASPRERREAAPARVNALFVSSSDPDSSDAVSKLNELMSQQLKLSDVGLRITKNHPDPKNDQYDFLSLEIEQQILDDRLAQAGERAADTLNLPRSAVLVYLANEIASVADPEKFSMYSVVGGLNFWALTSPPTVQTWFQPQPILNLNPNEIVLTDWLAKDLDVKVGDKVSLKYHLVGSHGELPEETRIFTVAGFARLDDNPLISRGLTPEVKGITDAKTFADWDQPFEMKMDRITKRDEAYWDKYRATPKAFVSLETAQEMWKSKYGKLTSLRVDRVPGKNLDESAEIFGDQILKSLTPSQTGFAFQAVKHDGLLAATGTTPFSVLFISFSFFLILSATILIALLFRLGIERRATSIGLLSAIGFTPRAIRGLFLTEGLIIVASGGMLGMLGAVAYATVIVHGLKTWWIGAIGTRQLNVYPQVASLAAGFAISVLCAMVVIWWALRQLKAISPRELLAGVTERELPGGSKRNRGGRSMKVGYACAIGSAILLVAVVMGLVPSDREAFPGVSLATALFFLVGILLLVAGLAFLGGRLDSDRATAIRGAGLIGIIRLGLRNAARNRRRSIATAALIASATFVIVAVAAGRRNPAVETPDLYSGNGGYTLVAETSTPVLFDLNTPQGREKLGFDSTSGETAHRDEPAAQAREALLVDAMQVMPFRVRPGEDASCLNIYQTRLPRILGVPEAMIKRGGFKFVGAGSREPWTVLDKPEESLVRKDGTSVPVYPVLGDMNTLQYSLHKAVGDTIGVPDDTHPEFVLKIAGMFDGSVFQGVLLLSERNFERAFPEQPAGYEYFLIETPLAEADALSQLLETKLASYGFDADRVSQRLAEFLAVQNTYLMTFQTLGALGLLLGTFGLATVMLRNVLERRAELALLRAVGFRNSSLAWLVLCENAFLLLWGLLAGTVSALLAMVPHLRTTGADVPWEAGGLMLAAVFIVGMLGALFAVAEAVRTPIIGTLRAE